MVQRYGNGQPRNGPGFDSRWEQCIYRASRYLQGTENGGAVSKWHCCRWDAGVKKSKNFHLSPGQVHQNFYLSCYQITCPCQGKIDYQWIFYLSTGHWVKIYACPAWNSTCPVHQDKWFFYPWDVKHKQTNWLSNRLVVLHTPNLLLYKYGQIPAAFNWNRLFSLFNLTYSLCVLVILLSNIYN